MHVIKRQQIGWLKAVASVLVLLLSCWAGQVRADRDDDKRPSSGARLLRLGMFLVVRLGSLFEFL